MRSPRVAVIGAGMSGLCMGAALRRAGVDDFVIYEKADRVGGTWRDNTYPGLSCDVPSRFYQFSFAPNPSWRRLFSPGAEIYDYLADVARRYDLLEKIRFGTTVLGARMSGDRWVVSLDDVNGNGSDGGGDGGGAGGGDGGGAGRQEDVVDFLVLAGGSLHHPKLPDIEGLDTFDGPVFHSSRWDHGVETRGRRVAVVGTGSTGVQLVCGLAGVAAEVELFQRTAQWVVPLPNHTYRGVTRRLLGFAPPLSRLGYEAHRMLFETAAGGFTEPGLRRTLTQAICRLSLLTVRDRELRRRLTPSYEPMCKRLVISAGFYAAMQRPDVTLVTEAIERVEPSGVRTADGELHETDVIVLATGFDAQAFGRPLDLVGPAGATLDAAWSDGPRGYRTVAVPGLPNFFTLLGPHSPVGNYSVMAVAETQVGYVMRMIERWRVRDFDLAAPTRAATDAYNAELRDAMPGTVWTTGCDSWYLDGDGLPSVWPWTPRRHRDMLREPIDADYGFSGAAHDQGASA